MNALQLYSRAMNKKLAALALAFVGAVLCGAAIGVQSHVVERAPVQTR